MASSLLDRVPAHRQCSRAMTQTDGKPIEDMTFEEALAALEVTVRRLESGDVPLDESIALYERGEALRKACQARLDAAQAKIDRIVTDAEGRPAGTAPFDQDA